MFQSCKPLTTLALTGVSHVLACLGMINQRALSQLQVQAILGQIDHAAIYPTSSVGGANEGEAGGDGSADGACGEWVPGKGVAGGCDSHGTAERVSGPGTCNCMCGSRSP